MTNPYEVLGLEPGATEEQITRKFRQLAQRAHPDKGGNPDEYDVIVKAYNLLLDKEKRAFLDKHGILPSIDTALLDETARREIVGMLLAVVQNTEPGTVNYKNQLLGFVRAKRTERNENRARAQTNISKLTRTMEAVKVSPTGAYLTASIEASVKNLQDQLVRMKELDVLFDRMEELVRQDLMGKE